MHSNSDEGESSQNGDIKSAFDATREVLLSIEIRRTIELLDVSWHQGLGFEEAKALWLTRQLDSLKGRYAYLFSARLPWWSYIRNPIWTLNFLVKRKKFRGEQGVNPEELEKLDVILGRAEFSAPLSPAARNFMRQQIDNGEFSRWTALSMVRSFGCKISKDGGIAPSPVGKFGMIFGATSSLVLTTAFFIFAYALCRELGEPCVRPCVVAGASQLLVLAGYFAALSLSLSWGRQRAARILPRISGEQGYRV
jgi:hypothetical protein